MVEHVDNKDKKGQIKKRGIEREKEKRKTNKTTTKQYKEEKD